jgi:hypothetical protein
MKKLFVLSLFCLFAYSVTAGCVATVSVPPPEPVVMVEAPAPAVAGEVAIAAPPALEIQEPELVVVPSGDAYVYMVPNVYGVYFYDGLWYRNYNGFWFRSNVYNGAWIGVNAAIVPGFVIGVAPEYAMVLPVGYYHIPYGVFYSGWRGWGNSHHWHGQSWYKNEMRPDVRRDRLSHIDRQRGSWTRGEGRRPAGFSQRPGTGSTQGGRTIKGSDTIKGGRTIKGGDTIKSGRTIKGTGTIKSANTVKNAQTIKRTQTNKNVQTNRNVQTTPRSQTQPKQKQAGPRPGQKETKQKQ